MNTIPNILIVDDHPVNIDVLGDILADNYQVSVATDGQRALDILGSENRPDLVLLDIMMPVMDGYEVCRRIKADPEIRDIPVLFISAKADETDETKGLELGAVDYLRKPVNPTIAMARIKAHLELKRLRDALQQDLETSENNRRRHQAYFQQLFASSPRAIMLVNSKKEVVGVNPRFVDLFGKVEDSECLTTVSRRVVPPDLFEEHHGFLQSIIQGNTPQIETERIGKNGQLIPVSIVGYPSRVDSGMDGVFIVFEDISERKTYEEQLRHQAFHDALTNIPNRLLLAERVNRALTRASRNHDFQFAFLMIDLDRFKSINDSLGHLAGDQILKEVSIRLGSCIRSLDTAARLGGDEFSILIEGYNDDSELKIIVRRVLESIEEPIPVDGTEVHISCSIGVVASIKGYNKAEEIFRDADLAMYEAKAAGKAGYCFFNPDMYRDAMESMQLESDLRNALSNNELELFYQPIVDISTESIQGFEALVRWHHPKFGMIFPDRFIPIAEESGLIVPLGRWILREACLQLKSWLDRFDAGRSVTMNINISVKQFLQLNFVPDLKSLITEVALPPNVLKLELTESLFMEHSKSALEKIREIKDLGVKFVIDDFGTGYSSLSYIHKFPVDVLKIDRAFVQDIETGPESLEIVKTIINLSRNLNMTVVAEGIETKGQLEVLNGLSCQKAQGYLFSRPLDRQKACDLLKTQLQS